MNEGKKDLIDKNYDNNSCIKQLQWNMAIGLQKVDNLKPSKYLTKLLSKNIVGSLTLKEVEIALKKHYKNKENQKGINYSELECDFVSVRMVELLQENSFELSIDYLKYIHKNLFQYVYEFAGKFRKINFSKHEKMLNNDSVAYGDCNTLNDSLEYDILHELYKDYNKMNINEVIDNISKFSSNIWRVHPFRKGNTRTTAIFIIKYLISLGYDIDISIFKDKSVYYRDALVRSNYYNNYLKIREDINYLVKFYENLLKYKNNKLDSNDLIVKELFN